MLNSILLLGSCYNKYKKASMVFTIALILNAFIVQFDHVKLLFFLYNIIVMLLISLINKKIKNNTIKLVSSSCSILIWSVLVDIACYYMFPLFNFNMNLLSYIMNGIMFNMKYVAFNGIILIGISVIDYSINTIRIKNSKKLSVVQTINE